MRRTAFDLSAPGAVDAILRHIRNLGGSVTCLATAVALTCLVGSVLVAGLGQQLWNQTDRPELIPVLFIGPILFFLISFGLGIHGLYLALVVDNFRKKPDYTDAIKGVKKVITALHSNYINSQIASQHLNLLGLKRSVVSSLIRLYAKGKIKVPEKTQESRDQYIDWISQYGSKFKPKTGDQRILL